MPERSEVAAAAQHQNGMIDQRNGAMDQQSEMQRPRNYLDHLTKIKYHCDDAHKDSERHWLSVAVEHKMLALFSSAFECSFLLAATLSALFSIVTPKVRNGLNKMLLIAVPLMALMPAFATAATDERNADGVRQQQQQPSDEMPAPASSAN